MVYVIIKENPPTKRRVKMIMSWYTAWPKIFFIMVREMRGLLRPYGLRSSRASVGGSVARAREAKVSIIRFTHSICTALSGESCNKRRDEGTQTPHNQWIRKGMKQGPSSSCLPSHKRSSFFWDM